MERLRRWPIWIMTGERCGSWYLTDLLRHALALEDEFLELPMAYGTEDAYWVRRLPHELLGNPPHYLKVLRSHFIQAGFDDGDRMQINQRLPGIRYIWLWRDDVFARAASLYCAENLRTWRVENPEQRREFICSRVEVNDDRLWDCLQRVRRESTTNWHPYFWKEENVVRVTYEALLESPATAVNRICWELGLDFRKNWFESYEPTYLKATHHQIPDLILKLRKLDETMHSTGA